MKSFLKARVLDDVTQKDRPLTYRGLKDALRLYRCLSEELDLTADIDLTVCKKPNSATPECGRAYLKSYALNSDEFDCGAMKNILGKSIQFGKETKSVASWIVANHPNLSSNLRRTLDTYMLSVGLLESHDKSQRLEIYNGMQEFSLTKGGDAASLLADLPISVDVNDEVTLKRILDKISVQVGFLKGGCNQVKIEEPQKEEQCKTITNFCEDLRGVSETFAEQLHKDLCISAIA